MAPSKRAAPSGSSTQKRTRFASPTQSGDGNRAGSYSADEAPDALLEEDLPEGAAAAKNRSKRQLKDASGYGSDSSNDDEGVVPSRRPKEAKDEEGDDDMDMFAEEEKKPVEKGKGKGKDKEFMDMEDIEGQEFEGRRRGGSELDDDDDSEEDANGEENGEFDEAADRKKRKEKALGFEVTPFNMKNEMEEGRFTADGEAYMENDRDPGDKHDVWLEDVDKDVMKKARRAHRERERAEQAKEEMEDQGMAKDRENELLRGAMDLMERGETVLEALQRLGAEAEQKRKKDEAGSKKKSWAERQKERKAFMAEEEKEKNSIHTSNPFTNLSNIVSQLTTIGHLDVYSLQRESIQRMLPPPPATSNGSSTPSGPVPVANGRPQAPPPDLRQFQYRFSIGYLQSLPEASRPVERETFGPFPVSQLMQWRGSGFFGGPACENVQLRKAGDEAASWGTWAEIVG